MNAEPTTADLCEAIGNLKDAVVALTRWCLNGCHTGELGRLTRETDASLRAVDAALAGSADKGPEAE